GDAARRIVQQIDHQLVDRGLETIGDQMHDPDRRLGTDIRQTQIWLLASGAALTMAARAMGLRPDVVLGHSFGECTAAWAADALTLADTVSFAKHRCDAVIMHGGPDGCMLSLRAAPSRVFAVLRAGDNDCVITHFNAPMQTVVAGPVAAVDHAKALLQEAGIAGVIIPVPAAFHTPAMSTAHEYLRTRISGMRARAPRCGLLSGLSNRYLAEPSDVMTNLVDQLVRPVCFEGAIRRLVDNGAGLLLEI
ncbi:MAG: acyltransferase domain-containing protein, partial [Planctomycetota bacterium]